MTAFETVCQMWSKEYIPVLERWGFKVTEVPREPADYLLGEKRWHIERGEKTKDTIVIYAFRWEKEGIHIRSLSAPACSWASHQNAIGGARLTFNKIIARLVVSATSRRLVRYRPHFTRKLGKKKVLFKFDFTLEKNEWRWSAWVSENDRARDVPYEFVGAPETDPIAIFPSFEKAVWFELLV
jgi:hypothetical protein